MRENGLAEVTMLKHLLFLSTMVVSLGWAQWGFAIGFIDSPSASCTRLKGNECYINWDYIYVNAAPNYMIVLRVTIGPSGSAQNVALNVNGFFQTSMYIDHGILGNGIPVKCGPAAPPSCTPATDSLCFPMGTAYSYTIKAKDSAGLSSANYGTVNCPPGF